MTILWQCSYTKLQLVKSAVWAKHSKMRYACIYLAENRRTQQNTEPIQKQMFDEDLREAAEVSLINQDIQD